MEISRIWHMKTLIITDVSRALRLIGKVSNRLIERIPGCPCFKEIQIVFTSTVDSLRNVLFM